jgi:hypothetical protein
MHAAIDFETYYDNDYGLKAMSMFQYCNDPRFDAYCVSFAREDGVKYVGSPRNFDWALLQGCDTFMHNASFDGLVLKRLQREGTAPADLGVRSINCTADMAAYFKSFRNLESAARNFLGVTLQKDTRDKMKGKVWSSVAGSDLGAQLLEYAQQDASTTLDLGMKLFPQWPTIEREASRVSREGGWRGLPLDVEYVKKSYDHLQTLVHGYLKDIPWYPDDKPLSPGAMRTEARKNGMWFPASLDQKDPKAAEWEATYAEQYPWVKAIRNYRRSNILLNRVKALWEGRNGDVFPFDLMYFGADTTGRWSGGGIVMRRRFATGGEEKGGKFNIQNMPREEMYGVDLRHCFKAPEGKAFYIVDYSQIECRILLWRAGDTKQLDLIRGGVHPYKAYAIANLGADETLSKSDRKYATAKACVLGCGYQAGAGAFQRAAKSMANLDLTEDEARDLVRAYRASNPKIVQYWNTHQRNLSLSASGSDETHEIQLASDRWLTYFNPKANGADDYGRPRYTAEYTRGASPESIYGGLLTENEIQATARDILRDAWVALDQKGFDVPATVHDEFIAIGPKDNEDYKRELMEVVLKSSPWAEGCPLGAEAVVTEHYEK